MLRTLHVERFRSLRSLQFEFGDLQILIGPNAAGKSNVIDVLRFLSEAVRDDLETAVNRRGGFDNLLFRGIGRRASRNQIAFDLEYGDPAAPDDHPMEYSLRVEVDGERPGVAFEELRFKRPRKGPGPLFVALRNEWGSGLVLDSSKAARRRFRTNDPGILALKAHGFFGSASPIQKMRLFIQGWQFLRVDVEAIRRPRRHVRETSLDHEAANLANVLRTLHDTNPSVFAQIVEKLQYMLAAADRLDLPVEDGAVALRLHEKGVRGPFDAGSLSSGTLHVLAFITALETMPEHGLLCIEEPEHGLHPTLAASLIGLIRERCNDTRQVVLTTHWPELVDEAQPDEVVLVERDEAGGTTLRRANSDGVRKALDDYKLGQLWKMRFLGAVP